MRFSSCSSRIRVAPDGSYIIARDRPSSRTASGNGWQCEQERSPTESCCLQSEPGGSISFAPEGEGSEAKWLSADTRHILAELDPKPDRVTIAINISRMNIMELMTADDMAGTSMERPELADAYRDLLHELRDTLNQH